MYSKDIVNIVFQKRSEGKTYDQIATNMGMSKCAIQNILTRGKKGSYNKRGRKPILNKGDKLKIKRTVECLSNEGEKVYSNKIQQECNLTVSTRTVQCTLKCMDYKYKRIPKQI